MRDRSFRAGKCCGLAFWVPEVGTGPSGGKDVRCASLELLAAGLNLGTQAFDFSTKETKQRLADIYGLEANLMCIGSSKPAWITK